MMSHAAIAEVIKLQDRAIALSKSNNPAERSESSALLSRISMIKDTGVSTDEARKAYTMELLREVTPAKEKDIVASPEYRNAFLRMISGNEKRLTPEEKRTLEAGSQTLQYTAGSVGGYLIPTEFNATVNTTMAQTDPVLDVSVTDFIQEPTTTIRPMTIQGYDLSTITATLIAETGQQVPGAFPNLTGGKILRGNLIFRTAVQATQEAETDWVKMFSKVCVAYGTAFGRSLGQFACTGSGSATQPLGILNQINTSYTTGSGVITLTDILAIYFSVNRYYRNQPRCSWIMSDFSYERIRKAVDTVGHPLLQVVDDCECLLGKPVHVSPSFGGGGSPIVSGTIAFGDFSHWHLRASAPTINRVIQTTTGGADFGSAQLIARVRFDSLYQDESGGVFPPIVTALVTP